MSETTSSTIGFSASNPMLRLGDESLFVLKNPTLPPQPPNFKAIAEANRAGITSPAAELAPFAPERLAAALAAGGRWAIKAGCPGRQYDLAHIPGTIGIDAAVNGFGTKAAWIAEPGAELGPGLWRTGAAHEGPAWNRGPGGRRRHAGLGIRRLIRRWSRGR